MLGNFEPTRMWQPCISYIYTGTFFSTRIAILRAKNQEEPVDVDRRRLVNINFPPYLYYEKQVEAVIMTSIISQKYSRLVIILQKPVQNGADAIINGPIGSIHKNGTSVVGMLASNTSQTLQEHFVKTSVTEFFFAERPGVVTEFFFAGVFNKE